MFLRPIRIATLLLVGATASGGCARTLGDLQAKGQPCSNNGAACEDGNPCTTDFCEATGRCSHAWTCSWWNPAWPSRLKLTFDNLGRGALTDFPVAVQLDATRFNFTRALPGGDDVRVVAADDTTELVYEIAAWDEAVPRAELYVRVPSIRANAGDDFVYLYFGNPGAPPAATPTAVWDSQFRLVMHMGQDSQSGQILDSTSFGNNGVLQNGMSFSSTIDGIAGVGLNFDGVDDYVDLGNPASLNIAGPLTVEAWCRLAEDQTTMEDFARVVNKWFGDLGGYGLFYVKLFNAAPYYGPLFGTADGDSQDLGGDTLTFTVGDWYHLAGTWAPQAGDTSVLINGSVQNSRPSANTLIASVPQNLQLGGNADANSFKGWMDEVRISSAARSPDWISATDASLRDTFQSYGAIENLP